MNRNYRPVIVPGSLLIAIVSLISFLPDRWPLAPRVVLAASVTVNSTTDVVDGNTSSIANLIANPGADGVISLREAMQAANNTGGSDTINFSIPGPGVRTITVTSGLPSMNQPIVIDGSSQPGFAGTPLIELNGNGTGGDGLVFLGGNSTVRSLIINRFTGNGLTFQNVGNNVIAGNYIGIDATGTLARANGQNGIQILGGATNTIGGLTEAARNVISGNTRDGIVIQNSSSGNVVIGNYIGTNAAGAAAVGNGDSGVRIDAPSATIGGGSTAARNVISGNVDEGVVIFNSGSTNNRIQGNYIGTDASGTFAIPNQFGVFVRGVSNTFIGTDGNGVDDAIEGNLISGNTLDGVTFTQGGTSNNRVAGNLIGTNPAGTGAVPNGRIGIAMRQGAANNIIGTNGDGLSDSLEPNVISGNTSDGVLITDGGSIGNQIRGNSIFSNGGLGIDLGPDDGVTPNDLGDPDNGPNNLQNFPIITDARQGSTIVQFTLNSTANSSFRVEFFSSVIADPSAHGEGQTFLGSMNVTTNGSGNFTGTFTLATTLAAGLVVSATATDAAGNTSEFSNTSIVVAPTAVKFAGADAVRYGSGTVVEWRTGYETNNLGFNVYREVNGIRSLLTAQPVAGSALFAAAGTNLTAGKPYVWIDKGAAANAIYWVEDIDLSGARTLHGPIVPQPPTGKEMAARSASLLTELQAPAQETGLLLREGPATTFAETAKLKVPGDELLLAKTGHSALASSSALGPLSQAAIKLAVNHDGWYRAALSTLAKGGSGTLLRPQLSSGGKPVPFRMSADGFVEFYGQGLNTPTTGERIYWLTSGFEAGQGIPQLTPGSTSQQGPPSFTYTVERRDRTLYFSGLLNGDAENIFGPLINSTPTIQSLNLKAVDTAQPASLDVTVQGVSAGAHLVRVLLNGSDVGTMQLNAVENKHSSFPLPANSLHEGPNDVSLQSMNGITDISLIDRVSLTFARRYAADDNQLRFTMPAGSPVAVSGFTEATISVFDITDPQQVNELLVTPVADGAGNFSFSLPAGAARTLLAIAGATPGETLEGVVSERTNWKGSGHKADLLVITHSKFREPAEQLAAYRRAQGLLVKVANVEDIYNEFSFGEHTPLALRDFLQWTTTHWRRAPGYVLLVGDSTWDPRDYFGHGPADFVPTKLIDTALMETASDDWLVDFNSDGLPEMSLGRLPVRTADDAVSVVRKIMSYDTTPIDAERAAVFVADGGFESMSAEDRALLPPGQPVIAINRGVVPDAETRAQILAALNDGPQLVNFIGHGSVGVWTRAGLLTRSDAAGLVNGNKLPLMVMLTCLNGYSHDVFVQSLGEAMSLAPNGGAVAVMASSGMTDPESQQEMARQLYAQLSRSGQRLGAALLTAKAATPNQDVRRTWLLLGDPTMQFRWSTSTATRKHQTRRKQ